MIRIKHGVDVSNLRPRLWEAAVLCERIFARFDCDLVITSGREGRHTVKRSKHYCGDAMDWRSKELPPEERRTVLIEIKTIIGPDFVVLLEAPDEPWEHFHVHYGPLYSPTVRRT